MTSLSLIKAGEVYYKDSADEWLSAMKALDNALEGEKEYKTKLEIVKKIE